MAGSVSPLDQYFNLNFIANYIRKRLLSSQWMLSSDVDTLKQLLQDSLPADGSDVLSQAIYFEVTIFLAGIFRLRFIAH